jgi:hypothetical protein
MVHPGVLHHNFVRHLISDIALKASLALTFPLPLFLFHPLVFANPLSKKHTFFPNAPSRRETAAVSIMLNNMPMPMPNKKSRFFLRP